MIDPKVPAIAASAGFGLSLAVGLLSGVSLAMVLLRALLMAALFAGFVVGFRFLAATFLPELFTEPGASDQSATDDNVGSMVNISIDSDGVSHDGFSGSSGSTSSAMPDFLQAEADRSGNAGAQASSGAFSSHSAMDSGIETLEPASAPSRSTQSSGGAFAGGSAGSSAGGLDVLPDLEDFVPRTVDVETEGGPEAVAPVSPPPRAVGETVMMNGFDTSLGGSGDKGVSAEADTMAKAIRTILTRET